jgi:tRNA (guanine26-N2/guanine27-N2)-dimethyltransferase
MSTIPNTLPLPGGIPDTHRPHTESTTTILVHKDNTAFLNPVQQYNRDLSIACIRGWNELRKEEAEARWRKKVANRKGKGKEKEQEQGGEEEVGLSMQHCSWSRADG